MVYQQQNHHSLQYLIQRHSLVDTAEKKIIKEYKSFERDKTDELVQADLTRFNDTYILWKMIISRKFWAARLLKNETDDNM